MNHPNRPKCKLDSQSTAKFANRPPAIKSRNWVFGLNTGAWRRHFYSHQLLLVGHIPACAAQRECGDSEIPSDVKLNPSSFHPSTPPIIFFTGRPSRARFSAARSAPLQCGPLQ